MPIRKDRLHAKPQNKKKKKKKGYEGGGLLSSPRLPGEARRDPRQVVSVRTYGPSKAFGGGIITPEMIRERREESAASLDKDALAHVKALETRLGLAPGRNYTLQPIGKPATPEQLYRQRARRTKD